MANDKKPYEIKKVDKKTAIIIISLLSTAIAIQLLSQQINFEPKELDEKIHNLLFSINISLFGIVFAIMAHKGMNKYMISAFGLLFVGILPIIALIPLIIKPITNFGLFFFPIYLGITFIWFFGINKIIGKPDNDEKEYAKSKMKIMLSYLLLIAIGVFVLYLLILSFYNLSSGIDS